MHKGNQEWLAHLKRRYPEHFDNAAVLEIGSYNVNGTARDYFKKAARYVGVDQEAGPCVDVVTKATETTFVEEEFDTLVYLSVFEHDPLWSQGFVHNLKWLRQGGLIILGWGAEGNLRHAPEPWALVPARDVLEAAAQWPVRVLSAFFEGEFFHPGCPGAFDLLARKLCTPEELVDS